jgi:isoflavone 2'-hydroxylase
MLTGTVIAFLGIVIFSPKSGILLLCPVLLCILLWKRFVNSGNWLGVTGTDFRLPFGDLPTLRACNDGLYLLHLCEQLDKPYVYRIWMGHQPTLMLAHPDAVRQFWQYHDETKVDREVKLGWSLLHIMGEGIGFKPYRARNRMSKFFHACFGFKNVRLFDINIEKDVENFMIQLHDLTGKDRLIDIGNELAYLSHDVSIHLFLGPKGFNYLKTLHKLVDELHRLMAQTYNATWINVVGLRWILPQAYKLRWAVTDFRCQWESLLRTLISEYRKEMETSTDNDNKMNESMLERFVQMEAQGKCNITFLELMDTYTEGLLFPTDLTAGTIVYTLTLLAMNQDVQTYAREVLHDKLGQDTRRVTMADIHSIDYLDWILSECQRIFPAQMSTTPEYTSQAMTIAGVSIQKNTMVSYDVQSMHRRDDIWDEPSVFRPERFRLLNEQQHKAIHAFGNGRSRRCLGEYFVKSLHKLLIARILLEYHIETNDNTCNIDKIPRNRRPFFYGPDICLRFVPL